MTNEEIAELEQAIQKIESKGYKRIGDSLETIKKHIVPILERRKEINHKAERNLKSSYVGMHIPTEISRMQATIKSAPVYMREVEDVITYCDGEIQDLLHLIELTDLNDDEMLEAALKLKQARNERRKAKDAKMMLQPLVDFVRQNQKTFDGFKKVRGQMSQVEQVMKARTYKPRELTSLEEAFNKANASDNDG